MTLKIVFIPFAMVWQLRVPAHGRRDEVNTLPCLSAMSGSVDENDVRQVVDQMFEEIVT